ncbi:hypothetical protein KFK09_004874 [Dendrobium nobile]|uniref:Reverse transcriptase domain-containing protein n=1 Tax=Dendrobium nobile TaxID=94219 RepID=A0A8T3BZE3_DENNO|nr:hypothetical protein KFK09_004874 [Dendrobium nobile]
MALARRRLKNIELIKREDGKSGWPSLDGRQRALNQFHGLLDGDVSEDKILNAVNSLGRNKSPGRDGITASFFKAYWDIIETVVVLIPKVTCSDQPSKFRPISLCQTIYKVVAKILVNRLKGALPLIISEEQAAFVPERSITTHCLLGQELIHKFKPKFFILTNGKFSNVINAECGFRQGCPLSPYLFILCSELLTAHFKQNFGEMGVPISLGGPPVSHLLYADDILFFAGASLVNARKVSSILTDYCSWTGQRVNRTKSTVLFSKWTPSTVKAQLTKFLGCSRVDEFEYLGIKFAMRRLTKLDFAPLVQRARAHTLAVLHEFEKMSRSFLWDKDPDHRGLHYVSWNEVARPTRYGGLGFHASTKWIGALRARVAWQVIGSPTGLLQKCLSHKYGDELEVHGSSRGHSNCWKAICDGAKCLRSSVRWRIGDGQSIGVLQDTWLWDRPLSEWPTLCDILAIEDLYVADFLLDDISWDRRKLLTFFGESLVDHICGILAEPEPSLDCMELIKTPLGSTISANVYNRLFEEEQDPVCTILKLGLRPRIRLFWWRIYKNKIPTNGWLVSRKFQDDPQCPFGCNAIEDLDHITTGCKKLRMIFYVLDEWGFAMPRFRSFVELKEELARYRNSHDDWRWIYCGTVFNGWRNQNSYKHATGHHSILRIVFIYLMVSPPTGWLKINLDGALRRSNVGGIGIVIRDDRGTLISAAGWEIKHWDSTQVELMAF